MGTAANMNYVAVAREGDEDVAVTAAVTAGVEGNATAAGEPATWRETDGRHAEGARCTPARSTRCCSSIGRSRPRHWRAWW